MNVSTTLDEERYPRAACLLDAAGLRGPFGWTPLSGGANNQVFRIDTATAPVLLKAYFVHPDDPRDRLGVEFGFAHFAWNHGVRTLPRPIAWDRAGGLALFEYVPGVRLRPGEVTRPRVQEALSFFLATNAYRDSEAAQALPAASEACFRLHDHLDCVRRQVARLHTIDGTGSVDRAAREFVRNELAGLSAETLASACAQATDLGLGLDEPLPLQDRCVSPSDFGFHNALRTHGGRLKFIDFEYAGWDDPAKLVADFFCQPQCPAPAEFFEEFAAVVAQQTTDPKQCVARCRLLLPVYRLKWCCIMLNDFVATAARRRRFARNGVDETERKTTQLARAREALAAIDAPPALV